MNIPPWTVKASHNTRLVENFYDDTEVQERYYAEVIELVKATTGAIDVQLFDHTVRPRRRAAASL